MKQLGISAFWVGISLLLAVGINFMLNYPPAPKESVAKFNKWYGTTLSEREIAYTASGFVDSEFFAAIPCSAEEFQELVEQLGMEKRMSPWQNSSGARPWWCPPPRKNYFILEDQQNSSWKFLEAHFDEKKGKAYFVYFDT